MNQLEQGVSEPVISTDPRERGGRAPAPSVRWLVVSLLLLVLIFGGLATAGALLTQQVASSRTFAVGDAPRLVLRAAAGSIRIAAGQSGQIQVVSRQRVLVGSNSSIPVHMSLGSDGNTLTVSVSQIPGFDIGFYDSAVDFEITAPSQTELSIQTTSGNITTQGITAPMTLSTNSGDITADGGSDPVSLSTSSGDITASNISGRLTLSTNSGDITVGNASALGNSTFQTGSGNLSYSGTLSPGVSAEFSTNDGDVTLAVPADAAFQVRAATNTGSISSYFSSVNIQRGTGAVAAGAVGNPPYAEVSIQVGSGDIDLRTT